MENERLHILALSFIEGIGPVRAKNLIAYCGGAEKVFLLRKNALEKIPMVGELSAESILKTKDEALKFAEEEIKFCEKNEIEILCYTDKNYPYLLKQVEDSPLVLYKKGNLDLNFMPAIAVVGTRMATDYGKEITEAFVRSFVQHGINVVSGLAMGIDIAAHRATLSNGGYTTAVFGNRMSEINPTGHEETAKKILERGAWLTEFHSRVVTEPKNFPIRNRIIAGLCRATLVVESDVNGGATITAKNAFDYNREVYAIPGPLKKNYSRGTNALIRDNIAKLVTSPDEILNDLELNKKESENKNGEEKTFTINLPLTNEEEKIITCLRQGEMLVDTLSEKTNIQIGSLLSTLLQLEFKGIVKQMPGKKFKLAY